MIAPTKELIKFEAPLEFLCPNMQDLRDLIQFGANTLEEFMIAEPGSAKVEGLDGPLLRIPDRNTRLRYKVKYIDCRNGKHERKAGAIILNFNDDLIIKTADLTITQTLIF